MKHSVLIVAFLGLFATGCFSIELTKKDLAAICNLHFKITVTDNKKPPEGVREFVEGMIELKNITGHMIVKDQNIIALHKILSMYTNNVDFKLSDFVKPGQLPNQQVTQQQQAAQPLNPIGFLAGLIPGGQQSQILGGQQTLGQGGQTSNKGKGNNNGGKSGKNGGKANNQNGGKSSNNGHGGKSGKGKGGSKERGKRQNGAKRNICNQINYPKKVDTTDSEAFKEFLAELGKQSVEIRGGL